MQSVSAYQGTLAPLEPWEVLALDSGVPLEQKDSTSPETLEPSEGEVEVRPQACEVELWSLPEDLAASGAHLDSREAACDSLVRGCSMGEDSQRHVLARVRSVCCCRSPGTTFSFPSLP